MISVKKKSPGKWEKLLLISFFLHPFLVVRVNQGCPLLPNGPVFEERSKPAKFLPSSLTKYILGIRKLGPDESISLLLESLVLDDEVSDCVLKGVQDEMISTNESWVGVLSVASDCHPWLASEGVPAHLGFVSSFIKSRSPEEARILVFVRQSRIMLQEQSRDGRIKTGRFPSKTYQIDSSFFRIFSSSTGMDWLLKQISEPSRVGQFVVSTSILIAGSLPWNSNSLPT
jgi:hypothetical protein